MDLELYLYTALGVLISVVLPLLRAFLPKPPAVLEASVAGGTWALIRPYVVTGVFSLIVAALVMAMLGEAVNTWRAALLAGYTADSTLQKFATGNRGVG